MNVNTVPAPIVSSKRCVRCRLVKSLAEFCRNKRLPDGLNCYCKACASQQKREWIAANPDKWRAFMEDHRQRQGENRKREQAVRRAVVEKQKVITRSYVAEKQCPKCGLVKPVAAFEKQPGKPYRYKSACRCCVRASPGHIRREQRYRERNREKIRQQAADYRKRMPDAVRAKKIAYDQRPDRKSRKAEADRVRWSDPAFRARRQEMARAWRKANPQKFKQLRKARKLLRRARIANNGPHETFKPIEIYERDGWVCGLCGKPVMRHEASPHPLSPSIDHVIPLSRGGLHTRSNVQLAHFQCNSVKGASPQGDVLRPAGQCAGERADDGGGGVDDVQGAGGGD